MAVSILKSQDYRIQSSVLRCQFLHRAISKQTEAFSTNTFYSLLSELLSVKTEVLVEGVVSGSFLA